MNSIVVLGPTAVGKTAIAVKLADYYNGEIISADSRQTYKYLDIGSGKDLEDYNVNGKAIPYHLIDVAQLPDEYNVFNYQQDFFTIFQDIVNRNKIPIICGGTGLYLDSVISNYELLPVPENKELRKELNNKSLQELTEILLQLKADYHSKNDFYDKERLIKAIEILSAQEGELGQQLREQIKNRPSLDSLIIGTTLPRPLLWENISTRLKVRLENGLLEEVQSIHDMGITWERLEKLGLEYRFCSLYLQGKINSKQDLFNQLFIAIRQFAKRQETWFRMMERKGIKINWLPQTQNIDDRVEAAIKLIDKNLNK